MTTASSARLDGISIRTVLQPGDLGYVMYRHGKLYGDEYQYGLSFETYVGMSLYEFYKNHDPEKDCTWVCEHDGSMIGFLLLMHRGNDTAQLRFFYLEPPYRGIGLGKKLMSLFVAFLKAKGYRSAYLLTTHEQESAAGLYKKFGFQLTEEKVSAAFGKPLREQRYELIVHTTV